MNNGQTNKNIPVLTDVISPTMPASTDMASAPAPQPAPAGHSTNPADIQARQLVEHALPIIMPELEKLARKTLLELVRKLQQRGDGL